VKILTIGANTTANGHFYLVSLQSIIAYQKEETLPFSNPGHIIIVYFEGMRSSEAATGGGARSDPFWVLVSLKRRVGAARGHTYYGSASVIITEETAKYIPSFKRCDLYDAITPYENYGRSY
jgi:hypothetical protein